MPKEFRITVAWVSWATMILITLGGWLFFFSGGRATVLADVTYLERRVTTLETLNRALHVQVTTIQADVSWIRRAIERGELDNPD